MADVIEEIVVTGRRRGRQEPRPPQRPSAPRPPVPVGGSRGTGERREGFVSPAILPIIEEIIVTAPRTQPFVSAARIGTAGFTLAGFFAVIGGFTLAAIIDKLGDQLLTRSLRESEPIFKPAKDTPLQITAPPPMFEILVRGVKSLLLPPLPIFISPDADPFRMIPIEPVRLPDRISQPAPVEFPTAPVEIPAPRSPPAVLPRTSPFVLPTTAPLPFGIPQPFPLPTPLTQPQRRSLPLPQTRPLPFAQPFTQPQTRPIASPGSRTSPRAVPLPRATALPQPFADPLAMPQPKQLGNCPPCKKDKEQDEREEERATCFRKMVNEGLTADLDQEFRWTEIECIT